MLIPTMQEIHSQWKENKTLDKSTCEVCKVPIIPESVIEGKEKISADVKYTFKCIASNTNLVYVVC